MDDAVRIFILMFTVIALIYILSHQPKPVAVTVIPYCRIEYRGAHKDWRGEWVPHLGQSWGPCTLMDRYEDV